MFKHTPLSFNFSLVPPAIFPSSFLYMLKRAKQNKTMVSTQCDPFIHWCGAYWCMGWDHIPKKTESFSPNCYQLSVATWMYKIFRQARTTTTWDESAKMFPPWKTELLGLGPNFSSSWWPGPHPWILFDPPFLLLCVWNLMVWLWLLGPSNSLLNAKLYSKKIPERRHHVRYHHQKSKQAANKQKWFMKMMTYGHHLWRVRSLDAISWTRASITANFPSQHLGTF